MYDNRDTPFLSTTDDLISPSFSLSPLSLPYCVGFFCKEDALYVGGRRKPDNIRASVTSTIEETAAAAVTAQLLEHSAEIVAAAAK